MSATRQIRARYDAQTIVVYQAYHSAIAGPALTAQRLVPPFTTNRLTWIKPSFLWLMHRSDWGHRANMERTLAIHIRRQDWDAAVSRAVPTTPDLERYESKAKWRAALEQSDVRVQWDPERDLQGQKRPYAAIQIGLSPPASEAYAKRWIVKIEDLTQLVRQIERLRAQRNWEEAAALLPAERPY